MLNGDNPSSNVSKRDFIAHALLSKQNPVNPRYTSMCAGCLCVKMMVWCEEHTHCCKCTPGFLIHVTSCNWTINRYITVNLQKMQASHFDTRSPRYTPKPEVPLVACVLCFACCCKGGLDGASCQRLHRDENVLRRGRPGDVVII